MKKQFFKVVTLPCAVAVALLGGSVLFSCSGDDETGVDESDFSASQFETLASKRMTRSAEGQEPSSFVIYESSDTTVLLHYGTIDYSIYVSNSGGFENEVRVSANATILDAGNCRSANISVGKSFYHNGLAIVNYTLKFRQFGRDFSYNGEYHRVLPFHNENIK